MTTEFILVGDPAAMAPPSPSLCRVSGYVIDHLGRPLKNLKARIQHVDSPVVMPTLAVFGKSVDVASDRDGLIIFDLIREAEVNIYFEDRGSQVHPVFVPDQASADLWDLVYPYLASVQLAVDDASIGIGATAVGTVTGTLSDGRELDVTSFSTLSSAAAAVVGVGGNLLSGLSAGVSAISVSAVNALGLYSNPPEAFATTFLDSHRAPYSRLNPPTVALGAAVNVTVS